MEGPLTDDPEETRNKAETRFTRKERQLRDSEEAMVEYVAAQKARDKKTARLRALRLAKEEAERQAEAATTKARLPKSG